MAYGASANSFLRGTQRREYGAMRRIGAWTKARLRDLVYCGAILVWSVAAFTVFVTGLTVTASLIAFAVGVVVWVGFVYLMRFTTRVDRKLAGWVRYERLDAVYRQPAARGFMPLLKTVSSDRQTWRDLGWLGTTSVLGFGLGLAAIAAAGLVLTYISMPIWYWAVTDPDAQYGVTNLGLFTVDTFGEALMVALIGLVLAPLALLLAHGCAVTHSSLAARTLGSSSNPAVRGAESVPQRNPV